MNKEYVFVGTAQLKTRDYINQLEKENQELKRNCNIGYENLKFYREENQKLKKQLDYLRSGEYYNQLRFERDMLQNVVDNGEVSKEDKEFIDMTQRNTELLEENQKLKKQLEEKENIACNWKDSCLENAGKIEKLENQQKEFISYLEKKEKEFYILGDPKNAGACKGILRKYKSIIGGK